MPILLIALGLFLWGYFGSPSQDVANWFWKSDAAPWEDVDAFYYPDRNDLTEHRMEAGLGSVEECRRWVSGVAAQHNDPNMVRGDYECGVQKTEGTYGITVYRLTVR